MDRVKKNRHYVFLFALIYVGIYVLISIVQGLLLNFFNFVVPFLGSLVALFAAMFVARIFYKNEGRFPEKEERNKLIFGSLLAWLVVVLLVSLIAAALLLLTAGRDDADGLMSQLPAGMLSLIHI